MKKQLCLLLLALLCIAQSVAATPKYIFYFIGDGMGIGEVALTEAYLASTAEKPDSVAFVPLNFTQLPVFGFASTYCLTSRITDSAASGTALATGQKTSFGTMGMDATGKQPFESVAMDAKRRGMKTGVVTSVSVDHATPASFYAHQPNRSMYYEIGLDAASAGLDLYAGSGLLNPAPAGKPSVWEALNQAGYQVVRGAAPLTGERVVWIQSEQYPQGELPLAIDRKEGDLALPTLTRGAIDYLYGKGGKEQGFFLMVEGGQIDWMGHANDAAGVVHETIDFANAIEHALEFYRQHPDQTLIVVTADHETGGVALGNAANGYDSHFGLLSAQKMSKASLEKALGQTSSWEQARQVLAENLSLGDRVKPSENEWAMLKARYEKSPAGCASAAVALLAKQAGVGWTTGAHTAVYVPVFAIGAGSEQFAGRTDNAQIAQTLRKLMVVPKSKEKSRSKF